MKLSQENKLRLIGIVLIVGILSNSYDSKPHPQVLGAATTPTPTQTAELIAAISPEDPPRYIAHAGGEYHGKPYTNSIATLENSYANGFRLQEVDLNLTTDNQIVLLHDWGPTVENVFGVAPGQRDLHTFLTDTAFSDIRPAQLADLAGYAASHPAAHIILDTKEDTVGTITRVATQYPDLRSHFIPFIYDFSQYDAISRLGFTNIALLVQTGQYSPEALLSFARNYRLSFIAMQPATLVSQLGNLPHYAHIYCWTINDTSTAQRVTNQLAYGIVTDVLTPPAPKAVTINPRPAPSGMPFFWAAGNFTSMQ